MGWKFRHECNCLASPGLLSDAEQLSLETEFSFRTEQPLWILFLASTYFSKRIFPGYGENRSQILILAS